MPKYENPEYRFNPFEGKEILRGKTTEAREAIKEYVLSKVLEYIGDAKSPVSGGEWEKKLTNEAYAARKAKISGNKKANLELYGDLLDSLRVDYKNGEFVLACSKDQAGKSDGHNNFSGKSKLPPRQFIPNEDEDQRFKRSIEVGIKKIVEEYTVESDD